MKKALLVIFLFAGCASKTNFCPDLYCTELEALKFICAGIDCNKDIDDSFYRRCCVDVYWGPE